MGKKGRGWEDGRARGGEESPGKRGKSGGQGAGRVAVCRAVLGWFWPKRGALHLLGMGLPKCFLQSWVCRVSQYLLGAASAMVESEHRDWAFVSHFA